MERTAMQEFGKDEVDHVKENFENIDGNMFGDGVMNSRSTSPLESTLLSDPDSCGMCGYVYYYYLKNSF